MVASEPVERDRDIAVEIDLDRPAAVVDKHQGRYAQPYTVRQVREGVEGQGDLWLLSGGVLVRDRSGRIAVGLRDGNAADPFMLTNIGAGRCDRRLAEHCEEEFQSEFILCLHGPDGWAQVRFGDATPPLAEVRARLPSIRKWKSHVGDPPLSAEPPLRDDADGLEAATNVVVEWTDRGRLVDRESLRGYALVDGRNHTIEFRLPVRLALSPEDDDRAEVFFAEGTGYALWMRPEAIRELEARQTALGLTLVTPLLAAVAERIQ